MDTLILESITCPITHVPMSDPVQGNDGHTYERSAIERYLREKNESPISRGFMTINDLKPNLAIKYLCDKYHNDSSNNEITAINNTEINKAFDNNIEILHDITKDNNNSHLMFNFSINENSIINKYNDNIIPQDIILVIDRSGSMCCPVEAKDENGSSLETKMSIQDIVNHSAKTIVNTLNIQSRIAIVAFDHEIKLIKELIIANEGNKKIISNLVENIKPGGQTNIWGGIEKAIEILNNRLDKSRNAAIFMLTDGQPNISPARGEIETLKRLREKKKFIIPIYTFGFGYNLSRGLLYDIAKYSNGCNGHIPDGSMIATVFCNFIANILTNVVCNLKLHINSHEIVICGDYNHIYDNEKEEIVYDIGCIQFQQTRNIIFKILNNTNSPLNIKNFTYYYSYNIGDSSFTSSVYTINIQNININNNNNNNNIETHVLRSNLVESIREMIIKCKSSQYNETNLIYNEILRKLLNVSNPDNLVQGMIKNLEDDNNSGQIKLAISQMYFYRWGEFYLDQLSRSLNQQIKPNFKDEACIFGGKIFNDIVDHSSDIFDSLPAPKPSINNRTYGRNYSSLSSTPINMSMFNNINGGCFDNKCYITMKDGSKIQLFNLKPNDEIMSSDLHNNITYSRVICILERVITNKFKNMVTLPGGLSITPWHPIKYKNKWQFPNNIKNYNMVSCTSIITLLLDNNHIGFINDYQCIMLGHNYKNNILEHEYYGTNKIVKDMKSHPDWKKGHIIINDNDNLFTP